ncbi:NUDIX hydrolase [Clostridiaceae bacterium M8S5]|nr:NUDIX hydrolase [Clostridiaceae bacterium M8S5]
MQNSKWLKWAKELQFLAQCGLAYSKDRFDIERFERIRDISVEIVSEYTEIEHKKIKNLFANESGYQTPKVDVRAAIFNGDKILMVKEKSDGKWTMPGGWADTLYSVYENVKKEAMEEAGANVETKRIIAVMDMNKHFKTEYPYSIYKIYVECDYIDGDFKENAETEEATFFNIDNIPELSFAKCTKEHIKMCFEARNKTIHQAISE